MAEITLPSLDQVQPGQDQAPVTPSTVHPVARDQSVINLAKAIRQQESGGDFNKYGDNNSSFGAYQWNNQPNGKSIPLATGELPSNWKGHAQEILGDANAPMTPENQNAVAYGLIKQWKDQGLTAGDIAAKWNSGSAKGWENKVGTSTINGKDISYNVPQYVKNVMTNYQKFKSEGDTSTDSPASPLAGITPTVLTPEQQADKDAAERQNPTFAADTTNDSFLSRAGKMLGNIPGSAFNFAKGAVQALNPVTTFGNLKEIAGSVPELISNSKNIDFGAMGGDIAKNAYNTIVPEAGRSLVDAAGKAISGNGQGALEDVANTSRAVQNDPVGQILPFLMAAKGGAELVDNVKNKSNAATMHDYVNNIAENTKNGVPIPEVKNSNLSGAFDNTISKVASPVTAPISYAFGKGADLAKGTAEFGARQLTGLDKSTMETAAANPNIDFSKVNRTDLGKQIQGSLDKRVSDLEDTGKGYQPIRDMGDTQVKVTPDSLERLIKSSTGLDMEKGQLKTSTSAKIRDPKDVRALQNFYDTHKAAFAKGYLTPDEFLNIRQDMGKLSKYDREVSKSQPLEDISKKMYSTLNTGLRSKIPGLTELDAKFAPQISELKDLKKGLVDKDGNLTDTGLTKIARVTENRPNLAAQLEKISPGFMKQVKILQAAEDLRAVAEKHKVGTYRQAFAVGSGGLIAGIATMNPVIIGASIAEMLLTNPENAMTLIQKYGQSKAVIQATIDKAKTIPALKTMVSGIKTDTLVDKKPSAFSSKLIEPKNLKSINENPIKMEEHPEYKKLLEKFSPEESKKIFEENIAGTLRQYKLAIPGSAEAKDFGSKVVDNYYKTDIGRKIASISQDTMKNSKTEYLYRYGDKDGLSWTTKADEYFNHGGKRELQKIKLSDVADRIIYADEAAKSIEKEVPGSPSIPSASEGEIILRPEKNVDVTNHTARVKELTKKYMDGTITKDETSEWKKLILPEDKQGAFSPKSSQPEK